MVFIAASIATVRAEVYRVETVPDPKQAGQEYYVSNPDGVLQQSTVDEINSKAEGLDKAVEVELCVVAIQNFDENQYADAYTFALNLFNTWGIGKAGKNTGVLLFLAKGSRDVQIITGGGMEGLLPDITCGQILDANLSYLSEGDFDHGMIAIVQGIEDHLMTDAAKAELLLGWKAKENDAEGFGYVILGFILTILLAWLGYKKLQGKPGQRKESIQSQSAGTQTAMGCLSWLFPLPMLFLYLYYRYARKNVREVPDKCSECGHDMVLLSDGGELPHLTPVQIAEEHIHSMEHDVWECPNCKHIHIQSYKGKNSGKYSKCPQCGAMTYETINRETLKRASYTASGQRRDTCKCAHCGFLGTVMVVLPMLEHTTSSGSGGGGGGYRSSGGGSWGGGHSFGGGAGRKF